MPLLKRTFRRLEAWLAAGIVRPDGGRTVALCLAGFAALGVLFLCGQKAAETLFIDSPEAYAWGQRLLLGYGRHPPVTGWIAWAWYSVFPAADWASYALSRVMTGISMLALYGIARRVLPPRRAALLAFAMVLYPLFNAKSDRFNNYQVLVALVPVLTLVFLIAYRRCTPAWGVALGIAAAAASLTHYAALVAVAGIGVATLAGRGRARFFASPAPYAAAATYLLLVIPHLMWIAAWNFPSLRWAMAFVASRRSPLASLGDYVGQHAALLALPLLGLALALWPWRRQPALSPVAQPAPAQSAPAQPAPAEPADERRLLAVIAAATAGIPMLLVLTHGVRLVMDWGNPLFLTVPLVAFAFVPQVLVTRRAVARGALLALGVTAAMFIAAAAFPFLHFKLRPEYGQHEPRAESARTITALWRARYGTPLPYVVGWFTTVAPVTFYSRDHPLMYADFDPAMSPWLDVNDVRRRGFIGVCDTDDPGCAAALDEMAPNAEKLPVSVTARFAGMTGRTYTYGVWIVPPAR